MRLEPLEDRRLLAAILYVNDDAGGLNTGASWTDAYTDLQSALAAATAGDEIWVAAGTYRPTPGTDPSISFNLKEGVSLYGGFAATETARDQRNWSTNVTTLSGDIGSPDINTANSEHVVYASGVKNATFDGFTVTAGYANSDGWYGGGMYCAGASPRLANVRFIDNRALFEGGGMWTSGSPTLTNVSFKGNGACVGGGLCSSSGSPILDHVDFIGNSASSYGPVNTGGGMAVEGGSATLTNVKFVANVAIAGSGDFRTYAYGGGLYVEGASATLTNVTFSGNVADQRSFGKVYAVAEGAAMYVRNGSAAELTNVTFAGNRITPEGSPPLDCAGLYASSASVNAANVIFWGNVGKQISGTPTVTHSIVQGGWAGEGNLDADPLFVDAASGNLHLKAGSPAIDSGTATGSPSLDLDGNPRPLDGDGDGTVEFDMGAYEFDPLQPVAEANGPYTMPIGGAVTLSAAGSHAPNGTVVRFEWDLNYDGSTFDVDATGSSPTFFGSGMQLGQTRTVALRVTDNDGAVSAIDTATVSIWASVTPGLYDPATSTFYLRCENTTGMADFTFAFGEAGAGWQPLAGDWDGDGLCGVGLYDPKTSTFYLTNSYTSRYAQYTFRYGQTEAGWLAVAGDWNADGRAGVGLYDPLTSTFFLTDSLADRFAQYTFGYGVPGAGWKPISGDWNADRHADVGLYDPQSGTFYLTDKLQKGVALYIFAFGDPTQHWEPLAGDWNADGRFGYGLYDAHASAFYLANNAVSGNAEIVIGFGVPTADWQPVSGCWTLEANQTQATSPDSQAVDQLDLAALATDELTPASALDAL